LRTVSLFTFLGWVYVAAVAVVHPERLPDPIVHWLSGPRHDTFGAVCFVVSVVTFVGYWLLTERRRPLGIARAIIRAGAWYGTAAWIYIAGNSISHPDTLHRQLTHFAGWPTEEQFALACFACSALCHFLLPLLPSPPPEPNRPVPPVSSSAARPAP
jgi:hypothetical protein